MKGRVALYGFGGGSGGSGAALTVNAPAGVTVTVSKDGKSKNKTANSSGIAVFKGLSTGEWTVTITDGEKTASKPVTIISDFNKTITFFSATIHVTYPAGSTCTATDGVTTLTAPDTSGTWDCVVPNAGTWTVSLDSGFSEKVTITNNGDTQTLNKWHLYNRGNECTAVTGGWGTDGYKVGYDPHKYTVIAPDIADRCLILKVSKQGTACVCGTIKPIDLSKYNTLNVEVSDLDVYQTNARIVVHNTKTLWASGMTASKDITANGTISLPVSGLNGAYYVSLIIFSTVNKSSQSLKVSSVTTE